MSASARRGGDPQSKYSCLPLPLSPAPPLPSFTIVHPSILSISSQRQCAGAGMALNAPRHCPRMLVGLRKKYAFDPLAPKKNPNPDNRCILSTAIIMIIGGFLGKAVEPCLSASALMQGEPAPERPATSRATLSPSPCTPSPQKVVEPCLSAGAVTGGARAAAAGMAGGFEVGVLFSGVCFCPLPCLLPPLLPFPPPPVPPSPKRESGRTFFFG